jgi:methyltransferase (TIGR00027 family)
MRRAFLVARSRFVEDALERSVQRGVRQYVVLGAGLDTFAYRNPHAQLQVFEVDHPATQALKLEKLRAGNIAIPQNVSFVPFDFEHRTLAETLAGAALDLKEPVFFSWLGVTMYLSDEAVMETLRWIQGATAEGSQIVFDYMVPLHQHALPRRIGLRVLMLVLVAIGEPFRSFFDPALLARTLKEMGFRGIDDSGPADVNAMYFRDRIDGLEVGGAAHLMTALV